MAKLFLQLLDALTEQRSLDPELFSLLPRSYKRVGHIAIFNLNPLLTSHKTLIGETILPILHPSIRTIARFVKPIGGVTRKPSIEWLAGDNSFETIHIEHKTKYCINPQVIMLSAGNHYERKRIIDIVSKIARDPYVVLDMFSCIGNLSLPLVKHLPSIKAIFLEINPMAITYLKKSLSLNKIETGRYSIIEGDNRLTCPENIADFVIMGYFGIDEQQLKNAIGSLNVSKSEGWIQIHDSCFIDANSKVLEMFKVLMKNNTQWRLDSVSKFVVKSIGPSFQHLVFDCHIKKK